MVKVPGLVSSVSWDVTARSRYRGLPLEDSLRPGALPLLKFAISRTVMVAAGRFAPGHLGELTQQVPFEMVDAVLAETGRVQPRARDLPARVVVYLLLAAGLFAGQGYRQVWARLVAAGRPVRTAARYT